MNENNPADTVQPEHAPRASSGSAPRRKTSLLKKVFLSLAAIVVVFIGVVAMQPSEFRIVRSATIAAPPAAVFAQVNDFHAWDAWSPWAKIDPASKVTFEGPSAGSGAIFKWNGNDEVGEGIMTLTESHPHDLIKIRLEFVRPFPGTSYVEFTFKPEGPHGEQTLITWSMAGHNNFLSKMFCMIMNMDKMVGADFEKGLAQMKAVAEAASKN